MRASEGSCQGEMFIHVWINNDSLCCGQSQESDLIYYTEYKQSFSLLFQYLGQVNTEGKWTLQRDQGLLKKRLSGSPNTPRSLSTLDKLFDLSRLSPRWGWPLFQRVCDRVESNGGIKVLPPYFYHQRWVFKPLQKKKKHQFVPPTFHIDGELKPIWKREKSPNAKGKSSKVCWKAKKKKKHKTSAAYLTWVAMHEKMTSPVY